LFGRDNDELVVAEILKPARAAQEFYQHVGANEYVTRASLPFLAPPNISVIPTFKVGEGHTDHVVEALVGSAGDEVGVVG
jgi:hypothetical protein